MRTRGPALLLAGVTALGMLLVHLSSTIDLFPGLIVLSFLFLAAFPCFRIGIRRVDPRFPLALFLAAFVFKMFGSTVRFWALADLYHYVGDAGRYLAEGRVVARDLAEFDFSFDLEAAEGTKGMIILSGVLFTVCPDDLLASFYAFSFLAFVGSVVFFRAFLLAFPGEKTDFHRAILFFLPSILYWPSSLGKDAWVFLSSSLVAYGVAALHRRRSPGGIVPLACGLLMVSVVRPHVAGFMTLALAAAFALTVLSARIVAKPGLLLALGAIAVMAYFFVSGATEFVLGGTIGDARIEELTDFYERRRATVKGGSRVEIPVVYSLLGPIYALVTVLFRPFPFEAHNPQALVTSFETIGWLALMVARRKRLLARLRELRRNPLVGFAVLYTVVMILAQTTTGNLGIIARQRVQFLPFLWMLF